MITIDEALSIMEGKRRYIADRMPATDFNLGKIAALAEVIDFIKKENDIDEGYAE